MFCISLIIIIIVGTPIDPPTGDIEITKDLVQEYQERYMDALVSLYDKYKDQYAPDRRRDLQIVRWFLQIEW
jgi:hypothetical protein